MNFPNLFLSKLVIPKTKYCLKYQLKCADYRINFAMNCGSMSNPPSVPVYNPLTLDAQLTRASVYYLMESVDVELKFNNGRTSSVTRDSIGAEIDVVGGGGWGKKVVVTLPAITSWYKSDFGKGRSQDVARIVSAFLTGEQKTQLEGIVRGAGGGKKNKNLKVKFGTFDFRCRCLTLLEEDLFDMLLSL